VQKQKTAKLAAECEAVFDLMNESLVAERRSMPSRRNNHEMAIGAIIALQAGRQGSEEENLSRWRRRNSRRAGEMEKELAVDWSSRTPEFRQAVWIRRQADQGREVDSPMYIYRSS